MEDFAAGQLVFALNPKYRDGTRLRAEPQEEANFNGVWVRNDAPLTVLATDGEFVKVKTSEHQEGWIKRKNLSLTERIAGVTKDVVSNELITPDPDYIRGIKIYNLGIKEDPVPGQKFGKGLQHLISSQWLSAISAFVGAHFFAMQTFARHAYQTSLSSPGYDFLYFTNTATHLFHQADISGLHSQESVDYFLMATWLVMAAAEVDDFPFRKYTPAERAIQREEFYSMYLSPKVGPGVVGEPIDSASLGKFATPVTRRDLLPPIALERLGINNELSALKYKDPEQPLREGFLLSSRIDSLKRHLEGVHRKLTDEDHIIHLLWNFHAIYHVLVVFPEKNDLVDYTKPSEKSFTK